MKNEKAVKRKIKVYLEARTDTWHTMPAQSGFSEAGVPDFLVCLNGVFVAIEAKFGKNKPTPMQELQLERIRQSYGQAWVINEDNVDELPELLEKWAW